VQICPADLDEAPKIYHPFIYGKMDPCAITGSYHSLAKHIAESKPQNQQKQSKPKCMLERYTADLEDSWVAEFIRSIERAPRVQKISSLQLRLNLLVEKFLADCNLDHIEQNGPGQNEKACLLDDHRYDEKEVLDRRQTSRQTSRQMSKHASSGIDIPGPQRKLLTDAAVDELGQVQAESSPPSLTSMSSDDETNSCETSVVLILLQELWLAFTRAELADFVEDGGDDNSNSCKSSKTVAKTGRAMPDTSTPVTTGDLSTLGPRRARLPGQSPDSEDEENNDPKKPGAKKPRGRGPRMPGEFGCPFFKHDPDKHGGRGGCRDYSHRCVGNLLRVSDSAASHTSNTWSGGFSFDNVRIILGPNIEAKILMKPSGSSSKTPDILEEWIATKPSMHNYFLAMKREYETPVSGTMQPRPIHRAFWCAY
jgi:hypothetical protein